MHYGPYNFSANGRATITALDDSTRKLGQRVAPSVGDLDAIDGLYGSDLSVNTQLVETAQGADIDIYISNQSQQGVHDVQVDIDMTMDEVTADSLTGGWVCTDRASGGVLCVLSSMPGSAIERLSLAVSLPLEDPATSAISVSSKTKDFDLSNNTSLTTLDDGADIPQTAAVLTEQLAVADNSNVPIQQDAIAHVATSGGGSAGYLTLGGLLLLLIKRLTGFGIYPRRLSFLGKHRWHLHSRQVGV